MNTFDAAEILLKEGIISYEKSGITERVSFKDIASKYKIDESITINGMNHLFYLKLINIDTGGNYYLNPDSISIVLQNNQNKTLSTIIYNTSTINVSDNATLIQNINSSDFKQTFVKQIESEIPSEQKSLWEKIKSGPFLDLIVTAMKKLMTEV